MSVILTQSSSSTCGLAVLAQQLQLKPKSQALSLAQTLSSAAGFAHCANCQHVQHVLVWLLQVTLCWLLVSSVPFEDFDAEIPACACTVSAATVLCYAAQGLTLFAVTAVVTSPSAFLLSGAELTYEMWTWLSIALE